MILLGIGGQLLTLRCLRFVAGWAASQWEFIYIMSGPCVHVGTHSRLFRVFNKVSVTRNLSYKLRQQSNLREEENQPRPPNRYTTSRKLYTWTIDSRCVSQKLVIHYRWLKAPQKVKTTIASLWVTLISILPLRVWLLPSRETSFSSYSCYTCQKQSPRSSQPCDFLVDFLELNSYQHFFSCRFHHQIYYCFFHFNWQTFTECFIFPFQPDNVHDKCFPFSFQSGSFHVTTVLFFILIGNHGKT